MKFRLLPYIAALSAGIAVFAGVWVLSRSENKRFLERNRADVLNQLSTRRAELEGALNSRLFLSRGLVAYVSTHPEITQAEFERIAEVLLTRESGIDSIALYKNSAVSHIYPFKGHEKAIGFEPLKVPGERVAIERAIAGRNTVVAGPINLVEGGVGFISRTPIFLSPPGQPPESGSYWGLAGVVIDKDTLLREAGLIEPLSGGAEEQRSRGAEEQRSRGAEEQRSGGAFERRSRGEFPFPFPLSPFPSSSQSPVPSPQSPITTPQLEFALRGKDGLGASGETFFGDPAIFQKYPVILEVKLPNGSWQIAAIPKQGWQTHAPIAQMIRLGGGALALSVGVLVFIWVRSPEQLRKAVEQATTALRESEVKYRELVENANSIIIRIDTQGNITFFNEFAQKFFGYSESEILGKNIMGTIVPQTDSSGRNYTEMISQILKNPEQYRCYENENIRRNGDRVWIAWRNKALFDGNGSLAGILTIGTDISDRKKAEEELRTSQQILSLVMDNIPQAIVWKDRNSVYQGCNPKFVLDLGLENQSQVVGKTDYDFCRVKAQADHFREVDRQVVESNTPIYHLCEYISFANGRDAWLETSKIPLHDAQGNVVGILITYEDITERKRTEEALRESENKFRLLFEESGDAILLLQDDRFIDCNQAAVEMIGATSKEQLFNLHPSQLSPEFQLDGRPSLEKANENNALALSRGSLRFEWIHRRVDGTDFPVEILLTAIPLEGKKILHVVWRDITERKKAEQTLKASERRLRRQSSALLDLATGNQLSDNDLTAAIREITEVAARTLEVERVSAWLYDRDRTKIICLNLYERNSHRHSAGIEILSIDYPAYFQALQSGRIIAAHNAHTDPRTQEFSVNYLSSLGITSMLDAPIRLDGRMVGVICNEHIGTLRQWTVDEENFAASIADFVALAMEAAERRRAQEALQRANEELETRVEERTAALRETNRQLLVEVLERQRSEDALRMSEEKFSKAFHSSPDVMTITRVKDGCYLDVNETFLRVLGFEREEVIGHTSTELNFWIDPQDRNKIVQMLQENKKVSNQEYEFRTKSGEVVVGLLSAEMIQLDNEPCMLVVATDITQLKLAQEAQSRLVAILEATPDFIGSCDVDKRIFYINKGGRQMLGIGEDEDVSQLTVDDIHPEWVNQLMSAQGIPTAVRQGIWRGETALLTTSFEEIPVSQVVIAHRSGPKGEIAYFSSIIRDITEIKQTEEALRQAEEKYRTIFENAVEGIYQTTPDGRYISANPALAKIYGYSSPEELMDKMNDIGRQLYVDPNRRSEFIAQMEGDSSVWGFESQIYRKDRSTIWISENARAVRDASGEVIYYEGIVEDVSRRKLAEEAVLFQKKQAETLLLNILPEAIAERLKREETTIADSFAEVTVLFADIVGFTELSSRVHPVELVELLNEIFSTFDYLTEQHGLEKIKTIGDAYMVVGGLPIHRSDHAEAVAEMALDMQREINLFNAEALQTLQLRVGINTGPVVAGVIGIKKFIYDLWGDTVNTASRMESHGVAGGIQVTVATYERLKDKYLFQERGSIHIKGKGEMSTYLLTGRISNTANAINDAQ